MKSCKARTPGKKVVKNYAVGGVTSIPCPNPPCPPEIDNSLQLLIDSGMWEIGPSGEIMRKDATDVAMPVPGRTRLLPSVYPTDQGVIKPEPSGVPPNAAWMYQTMPAFQNPEGMQAAAKWTEENPLSSPQGLNLVGMLNAMGMRALALPVPGTSHIAGGLTVGDVFNAYFLKEGIQGLREDVPEFQQNPSWGGAGNIGIDVLQTLPGAAGLYQNVAKPSAELMRAWRNYIGPFVQDAETIDLGEAIIVGEEAIAPQAAGFTDPVKEIIGKGIKTTKDAMSVVKTPPLPIIEEARLKSAHSVLFPIARGQGRFRSTEIVPKEEVLKIKDDIIKQYASDRNISIEDATNKINSKIDEGVEEALYFSLYDKEGSYLTVASDTRHPDSNRVRLRFLTPNSKIWQQANKQGWVDVGAILNMMNKGEMSAHEKNIFIETLQSSNIPILLEDGTQLNMAVPKNQEALLSGNIKAKINLNMLKGESEAARGVLPLETRTFEEKKPGVAVVKSFDNSKVENESSFLGSRAAHSDYGFHSGFGGQENIGEWLTNTHIVGTPEIITKGLNHFEADELGHFRTWSRNHGLPFDAIVQANEKVEEKLNKMATIFTRLDTEPALELPSGFGYDFLADGNTPRIVFDDDLADWITIPSAIPTADVIDESKTVFNSLKNQWMGFMDFEIKSIFNESSKSYSTTFSDEFTNKLKSLANDQSISIEGRKSIRDLLYAKDVLSQGDVELKNSLDTDPETQVYNLTDYLSNDFLPAGNFGQWNDFVRNTDNLRRTTFQRSSKINALQGEAARQINNFTYWLNKYDPYNDTSWSSIYENMESEMEAFFNPNNLSGSSGLERVVSLFDGFNIDQLTVDKIKSDLQNLASRLEKGGAPRNIVEKALNKFSEGAPEFVETYQDQRLKIAEMEDAVIKARSEVYEKWKEFSSIPFSSYRSPEVSNPDSFVSVKKNELLNALKKWDETQDQAFREIEIMYEDVPSMLKDFYNPVLANLSSASITAMNNFYKTPVFQGIMKHRDNYNRFSNALWDVKQSQEINKALSEMSGVDQSKDPFYVVEIQSDFAQRALSRSSDNKYHGTFDARGGIRKWDPSTDKMEPGEHSGLDSFFKNWQPKIIQQSVMQAQKEGKSVVRFPTLETEIGIQDWGGIYTTMDKKLDDIITENYQKIINDNAFSFESSYNRRELNRSGIEKINKLVKSYLEKSRGVKISDESDYKILEGRSPEPNAITINQALYWPLDKSDMSKINKGAGLRRTYLEMDKNIVKATGIRPTLVTGPNGTKWYEIKLNPNQKYEFPDFKYGGKIRLRKK